MADTESATSTAPVGNGSTIAAVLRAALLWGVPLLLVVGGVYWYGSGGRYVSTENAYLRQDRVTVAAQVAGNVREVDVAENQRVEPGQPVLVLDDALFLVAAHRAEAAVASARVDVAAMQADHREKVGELDVARRASEYAVREYERQKRLAADKLVPVSALDNAQHASTVALGQIAVLELQVTQARARLGGAVDAPVDAHPQVRAALAELEKARVDLSHVVIPAPRAGVASHLPKVGDHLEPGQPAFAIVDDGKLWVEANFQETDLEWLRPGQPARVKIDAYPGHEWQGTVQSIAQATGAEFALLPAQNATGNWVKVVQRVPMRIAIDAAADGPPLRSGMSADVRVDTGAHRRFDRWFDFLH